MTTLLTVFDVTTGGKRIGQCKLEISTEHVSVRELIRSRVYQEVMDFNVNRPNVYLGLVQPNQVETELNGREVPKTRQIDWRTQYEAAIEAFEHCRLIVLINGHQACDLDEELEMQPNTEIKFLKIVPLVGG